MFLDTFSKKYQRRKSWYYFLLKQNLQLEKLKLDQAKRKLFKKSLRAGGSIVLWVCFHTSSLKCLPDICRGSFEIYAEQASRKTGVSKYQGKMNVYKNFQNIKKSLWNFLQNLIGKMQYFYNIMLVFGEARKIRIRRVIQYPHFLPYDK